MIIAKITATVFAALFCASFLLWGVQGIANYCASFIAFLLVAIATFYGYKKVVLSFGANAQALQNEPDSEDEEEEKPTKMSLLTKTYKGWLFPVRLAAYALFVLVFLYFANNNILSVFPFLIGIAVLPISVLIFMFFFQERVLIKVIKKELLIYLAILVALSLFMHPERITMIESPLQLVHSFAWSFGVYAIVAVLRVVAAFIMKFFRKKEAES